jgi:putative FmdB family regulatory protein
MPFYEYECTKCGHRYEVMLTLSEREEKEKQLSCPKCGKVSPRRVPSTFSTPDGSTSSRSARPSCNPGG